MGNPVKTKIKEFQNNNIEKPWGYGKCYSEVDVFFSKKNLNSKYKPTNTFK